MGHLAAELCKCKHAISRGETKYDSVVNELQQQKQILVPYPFKTQKPVHVDEVMLVL